MTKALDRRTLQMLTAKNAPEAAASRPWRLCARGCSAPATSPSTSTSQRAVAGVPGLRCQRQQHDPRHGWCWSSTRSTSSPISASFLYVRDFARKRATASALTACRI